MSQDLKLMIDAKDLSFDKTSMVNNSFYVTYAFLLTTATITFIEAISTKIPQIRHIMNLETVISVVAAYFYDQFMIKLGKGSAETRTMDYKSINVTRYMDWAITTPVMLWALCLALGFNNKMALSGSFFLLILLLNYAMLGAGFLGEIGRINKRMSTVVGFVFFFLLYGVIFLKYLKPHNVFNNQIIFWAFVLFWALYGVFHEMEEENKNIGYNVLDLFSKCFVGIFFWAYFTKSLDIFN